MLKLDSANMWNAAVGSLGIQSATESANSATGEQVLNIVLDNLQQEKYGFVNLLSQSDYTSQVERVYKHVSWADTMVVVGIGGSDLGGRALQNALHRPDAPMRVIFHGDTTDPTDIEELLREIELPHTVFNIVSESGATMETMAFYLYFKQLYLDRDEDWSRHFVFTTKQNSPLWKEALQYGIAMLKIPDDVGGRYSVLSAVGMLPALAMDIDINAMWDAARKVAGQTMLQGKNSVAWQIAWYQYLLNQQGADVAVFMPYSARLEEFGRWIRQLWAESLGKDGKGILPVQARGPADQHSQLQFYTQGKFLASVWFLRVEDHGVSYVIERADVPGTEYLENREFAELINIEQEGTAHGLRQAGRPSAVLELERVDAASMGELFMTFELAVAMLGELLAVNAFDQPGVQQSKDITYGLLGRAGYAVPE